MADPEKATVNAKEESEDIEESEDTVKTASQLTADMMKNPEVLAALQSRLGSMIGSPSGYIESLPKSVKRRIKALKKLQLECTKLEAKFYEEIHTLECKYALLYNPFYEKRLQVTNGSVEPTDEECDFPSDTESELSDDVKKITIDEKKKKDEEEEKNNANVKGVPEFWLTILKNVDMLAEMIQEHDEPILKCLSDIKVKFMEPSNMGFILEFHFDTNDYFTNALLTKEYELKCSPDESDPFSFEGPEIFKCRGCTIDWKKGKNVTEKIIKKKQKHKSRGSVRTITKTVQNDSFFNFFNPPAVPEDEEQIDDEVQTLLTADFEIGHFIRERIVPRAVLFFTGEALADDDYDEDEEDEDEEDDDDEKDEEDEENDPDFTPQTDKSGKMSAKPPPECKQQ